MSGTKSLQPGSLIISILYQILRSAFSVTDAEGNKLMNGTAALSSVLLLTPCTSVGAHPPRVFSEVL